MEWAKYEIKIVDDCQIFCWADSEQELREFGQRASRMKGIISILRNGREIFCGTGERLLDAIEQGL